MAFVHENVVYAHRTEIDGIVFPAVYLHLQFGELGFKVLFPDFQSFLHPAAPVTHGGLLQHFEAAFHIGQFFREYVVHGFFGLRNLAKLVVCQDNAIPVVVLDFREHLFAVGGGEILLARIEHLGRGVCLPERVGNLVHIGFQPIMRGFCTSPRRFISYAATHIIIVLPVPTSCQQIPPPFCLIIQIASFCEG